MIYLTGDTHGKRDMQKLLSDRNTKHIGSDDYLVILGDFGAIWYGDDRDKNILDWYDARPYTTLFVDGNHENFNVIKTYPVVNMFGGKVQRVSEKVFHLMRGEIYNIEGQSIFVMGGGLSIDKQWRVEGVSWWSDEIPSQDEFKYAEANLKKHDFKVDYIFSHCCSTEDQDAIFWRNGMRPFKYADKLTQWFSYIKPSLTYKHWYFGHYHLDDVLDEKHTCLYEEIIKLGDNWCKTEE